MPEITSEWNTCVGISDTSNPTGLVSIIQAFVPEFLPNFAGPPKAVPTIQKAKITNPLSGVTEETTVSTTTLIEAEYIGGNNCIIPCIYKGERVRILNYAGCDKFYWEPLGREPGMRRHEHLRWYAMAQPKGVTDGVVFPCTDVNAYFVDINTNEGKKCIHIHTSQADGEPFGYDIRICPQTSFLEIRDTSGNFFILDSTIPMWHMHNIYDSNIQMTKDIININCKNIINVESTNQINVKTAALTYDTVTTLHNASTSMTIKAPTYSVTSDNHTVATKNFNFSAATAVSEANFLFKGKAFTVANEHGTVPVIIIFGSNSW